MIAKVEESGYIPNGVMAAIQLRSKLRGLKDTTGQPIFKTGIQGSTRYALDGMDMYFPINGAFDPAKSLAIVGDWSQLVYSVRQDMTFKIFDSGIVQDPATKAILYNLMQNDMVALRAVMRLGWEIPNPINAFNVGNNKGFPVCCLRARGGLTEPLKTASLPAPSLSSMTKADLLSYAAGLDAGGVSGSMKKAEILAVLKEVSGVIPCVSYEFYTGVYGGTRIQAADFHRLITRAHSFLRYYTMGGDLFRRLMRNEWRMACCAIAEEQLSIDAAKSMAQKSLSAALESKGGNSKVKAWEAGQRPIEAEGQRQGGCGSRSGVGERACCRGAAVFGSYRSLVPWEGGAHMDMFPRVVTLYNVDTEEKPENGFEPTRVNHITILRGVLLDAVKAKNVNESGLVNADSVTLYIPMDVEAVDGVTGRPKQYKGPIEFWRMEDKTGYWTLSTGQNTFFVKGEAVHLDWTSQKIDATYDNVYDVNMVDFKDFGGEMSHWEVGGN